MEDFRHIVLTRFNCGLYDRDDLEHGPWLEQRLTLFTRYCLPSFKAQRNLDFSWLIYMDRRTPESFCVRLAELLEGYPRWQVTPLRDNYKELIRKHLRSLGGEPRALLTSRVDNDDAIHSNYVHLLHLMVSRVNGVSRPLGINFSYGYIADTRANLAALAKNPSNPFVSLLEPWQRGSEPITALAGKHNTLGELAPVREVESAPMWLALVHGGNLDNEANCNLSIPLAKIGPQFGLFLD